MLHPSLPSLAVLFGALVATSCSNFGTIEEGRAYRSGQPSSEQLSEWIEEHGIKTVLRLRGGVPGNESYDQTFVPTEKAGIRFEQVGISALAYPSAEKLLEMWHVFETAEYPILIHCRAGADRTALGSALYVLHRTDDLDAAFEQFSLAHLHIGMLGTEPMRHVLEMYREWHGIVSFPHWAEHFYYPPEDEVIRLGPAPR